MCKIIFLDIDGVMNAIPDDTQDQFHDIPSRYHVEKLNKIIEATGAVVVLSSDWRKEISARVMHRFLALQGFKGKVVGITPVFKSNIDRGYEIQAFIDKPKFEYVTNQKITSFVILDDCSDMAHLMDRLVLCNDMLGLGDKEVEYAIKILEREYKVF